MGNKRLGRFKMKKLVLTILIVALVCLSGVTAYCYLAQNKANDYSGEFFVEGGSNHEYAKVYHISSCL